MILNYQETYVIDQINNVIPYSQHMELRSRKDFYKINVYCTRNLLVSLLEIFRIMYSTYDQEQWTIEVNSIIKNK